MPTSAPQPKKVLVTGGLGFIGSHFVALLLNKSYHVINVDKKTYAIRKDLDFETHPLYTFIEKDICDLTVLPKDISYIVNFAAESHVENSLSNSHPFFKSNIQGVYTILELLRKTPATERPVLVHISTDEVYGDRATESFTETDMLTPSNPYSATKAAADQLVMGWWRTYDIPARICRSSNNYGYGQVGTKLIPNTMKRAVKGLKAQVHGNGSQSREWTWVEDNCAAILLVMEKGSNREVYNISTNEEYTNLEIVQKVLKVMGQPENFIEYVADRPNQDVRYSVQTDKIRALGWKPTMTVDRYLPICKTRNEERRRNLPPGKKQRILRLFKVDKLFRI